MQRTILVLGLLLAGMVTASFGQRSGEQSPPKSKQATEIEVLVNKAAKLVDKKGKTAFAEFRQSGSEWRKGDTYLFALDLKENTLFNAAFPEHEGKNQAGNKDANGKLYDVELVRVVQRKGSGWVDYMFPKPGQTAPARKWSYVKKVNIDGTPALIGAGFYPQ